MNASAQTQRRMIDAFNSAWVWLPAAAGLATASFDVLSHGDPGTLTLAGLAGLGVGAGVWFKRWRTGRLRLAEQRADAQRSAHQHRFNQLDRRLSRDGDERTNQALVCLRELDRRFAELEVHPDADRRPPADVAGPLRELLTTGVASLERSAELFETQDQLATDEARTRVMAARESLLREVEASVDQIVRALDALNTRGLDRPDPAARLAGLRRELDASLDVARRVERRMADLERDLEHGLDAPAQSWDDGPRNSPPRDRPR